MKNTPDLVINDRYAGDEKGVSYHVDHGTGYDPYDVDYTLAAAHRACLSTVKPQDALLLEDLQDTGQRTATLHRRGELWQ